MLLRSQAFIMITFLVTIFLLVISFYYYRFVKERQAINNMVIQYGFSRIDPMRIIGLEILKRSLVNMQAYCYRCFLNQSATGCGYYSQVCGYLTVNLSINLSNISQSGLILTRGSKYLQSVLTYLSVYYQETGCKTLYISVRSLSVGNNPYQGIYYSLRLDCLGEQQFSFSFIGVIDEKTEKPWIYQL